MSYLFNYLEAVKCHYKHFLIYLRKKEEIIITSAMREFARVLFSEASIANIIKDADISRGGSFYQ